MLHPKCNMLPTTLNREFLARAAEELHGLPPGTAIEQMLAD